MSLHAANPDLALPRRPGLGWAASLAERLSGLSGLAAVYEGRPATSTPKTFVRYMLQELGVTYTLAAGKRLNIPAQGPLIVIANHPFGAADGLILTDLLLQQRSDVLLLANTLLARVPELAPLVAPVDVFRAGASLSGIRGALRHLDNGGVLVVFPAGEVSRIDWRGRRIADPPWAESVSLLARRSGAPVLPIHIEGRAPWPSLLAGALHPLLRTARLPRDLLALRNRCLRLSVGEAVPAAELARLAPSAQIAYLRLLCDALGDGHIAAPPTATALQALAQEQPAAELAAEVARLPPAALLCSQGEFSVYCAAASEMPQLLLEIGRLRELSFRGVQEGTGLACDIDHHDAHYQHLFLWHHGQRQLIGAYRIGFAEHLLQRFGLKGLYTHSLFDYDAELFEHLGPAIEMGRSFVRPEWQRNFRALRLLWSGISILLDRNPELRCLFGPVSISASYSPLARTLMEAALSIHHADARLQSLVRPRNPSRRVQDRDGRQQVVTALAGPSELSRLISRLEGGSGVPVLVRQYLDLRGRFAGFNVDASFGNCLDGLVFVRVADIPAKTRSKLSALAAN